ncbi:hypothetical protein LENED_012606 [Lentinula edodes]|uniref:Uncharacterized protein n=1 Tax=Lentinula edodes TaxID=5353 RepID=A0A1Q3ET35_LENED|nr:hypothetical protein LENED_012606 [Lentinula edodes]
MLTGFEIPIIAIISGKVVAAIKFSRTSVLIDEARRILNDEHLTKLLTLLYELNPGLASENDDYRIHARAIFNDLDLMKGPKYILIRHIKARKVASIALEYAVSVTANTTDAKIKQAREKALKRDKMKHSKEIKHATTDHHDVAENNTARYITQTPSGAVFAYPRGTPENPTVACPVGSRPILPDGFKFGTLAYYYQTQTEEDDLVSVIEIRDMPKSSRSGVAQASSPSHRRQTINREELVEDIIREELQDIAGTAHFIGTLRAANGSDGDVASIATTYLSFDDTNTESESNFDSEVDTDGL